MNRLLPQPLLSLIIFGLWLVLAPAPSTGQIIIAVVLALVLPWATRGFWPNRPHVADVLAGLRLVAVVLFDIVTANIQVARQVIGPPHKLRPAFLEVPLDIQDPFVATILGSIITMTPGTLSVEIEDKVLLVHALHVTDAAAAIASIKSRYEMPLKKVFAC
jgi:multicomponent K+:H+ antiporter subunit E